MSNFLFKYIFFYRGKSSLSLAYKTYNLEYPEKQLIPFKIESELFWLLFDCPRKLFFQKNKRDQEKNKT